MIQKKVGKAMYLVVVSDTLAGEPFFEADRSERIMQESVLKNIQVIGVNGYKDRDCEFRLRIKGDDLMITDAHMEEFAVKGENSQEEKTVPPSSAGNQSGSSGSSGTAGSQQSAVATEEETKIQETDAQGTDMEETQDQDNGETDPNPTETADGIDNRTGEETGNQKDEKSGEAAEESKAKDGEAEKEDQDHGVREENNGDSGIDSGEALSVSSSGSNGISVRRHEVPVLFSSEDPLATASEAEDGSFAEAVSFAGEEADLVSIGDAKVLSEEERAALMGTDVAALRGEETKTSLFSFLSQPSFGMVVRSYGMTLLNTEVDSEGKLSPYETALTYYGTDASDEKETAEVSLF